MAAFHNSPPDSSKKSAENSAVPMHVRHAHSAWIRAKESLQRAMPRQDFHSLVGPMRLVTVLPGGGMLLALPPNKRLAERARNFRPNLAAAIENQNYHLAGFSLYPSDDALLSLWNHKSFGPFFQFIARKRRDRDRVAAERDEENARDRERLG